MTCSSDRNINAKVLFDDVWSKGQKNSPCDMCNIKYLGNDEYRIMEEKEFIDRIVNLSNKSQKTL
jgi:hypothetical protein